MINVSTEFKELMGERTDFRCWAEVTLADGRELTLGAKDFAMGGQVVTDGAGAQGLPLGAAVCRTVELRLANQEGKLDGYEFYGARLRLYLTFALSETEERVELGTFTVTEPESRGETVTVTAADDMYRTDRAYTTALTYPATLGAMFRELCDGCGVPYATAAFPNSGFTVASAPGEGYTCRQVLGYIAMLAGGSARVHRDRRMEILSYDPAGEPVHELKDWISLSADTDDVVVTGLETTDSEGNRVLEGSEGYVLAVEDPLMAGKEAAALAAMGQRLIGLRVRRFQGEYIAYPLAECMDTARIVDRKGNAFTTVLTDVAFTFGGRTALSNSAEAAARNASRYAAPETKVLQAARQLVAAERTVREAAVAALNERLAKASGMYGTRQVQPDGSSIWYLHDKPTLGESQAVMKLTSDAIGFSTDGGKSYPFGFTVTGEMVMGVIRSEGISADWVKVGGRGLGAVLEGFVGRDENDQVVSMLNASADQINIRGNRFVLDSDNFKVAADGTVTMMGADVSGDVKAASFSLNDVSIHTGIEKYEEWGIYPGSETNMSQFVDYVESLIIDADRQIVAKGYLSARRASILNLHSQALMANKLTVIDVISESIITYGHINVKNNPYIDGSGIVSAVEFKENGTDLASKYLGINDASVSADKLTTPRNINGVPFDGTEDITVKDDTKVAKTGDTMTGDLVVGNGSVNAVALRYVANNGGRVLITPPAGFGVKTWNIDGYNGVFRVFVTKDDSTTKTMLALGLDPDTTYLHGKADKVAHPLTFTGGASGSYDGSEAKTVKIPSTASDVGAVPTTRKVNNKALSSDISLGASDVGAVARSGDAMTGNLSVADGAVVLRYVENNGGRLTLIPPEGHGVRNWNIDGYNGIFRVFATKDDGSFSSPLLVSIDPDETVLHGTADKVGHNLTFTVGGSSVVYDGSTARSVKIPSTASDVGAVARSGDTMTGDLVVGNGDVNAVALRYVANNGGRVLITPPAGFGVKTWNIDGYNGVFRVFVTKDDSTTRTMLALGLDPDTTYLHGKADKVAHALTFTGGASGSWDGSENKSVAIPGNLTALSDGVWKTGNTLTFSSMIPLSGMISSGTTTIQLLLPLGKPVASGVAASVTALKGTLRGAQGYIDGSSEIDFKSGSTYTVSTALERTAGLLRITIQKSSAFTNVENNTPVSLLTSALTVSFAASSDEPMPGPEIFGDDAGMEGPSIEDDAAYQEKEAETV